MIQLLDEEDRTVVRPWLLKESVLLSYIPHSKSSRGKGQRCSSPIIRFYRMNDPAALKHLGIGDRMIRLSLGDAWRITSAYVNRPSLEVLLLRCLSSQRTSNAVAIISRSRAIVIKADILVRAVFSARRLTPPPSIFCSDPALILTPEVLVSARWRRLVSIALIAVMIYAHALTEARRPFKKPIIISHHKTDEVTTVQTTKSLNHST